MCGSFCLLPDAADIAIGVVIIIEEAVAASGISGLNVFVLGIIPIDRQTSTDNLV